MTQIQAGTLCVLMEPSSLTLKYKVTFHFLWSSTSDTHNLLTLLPPGCPVNVTLFSPDINKLSLKGVHHLELVNTAGSVIGRMPLVNHGCSAAYIRGSSHLSLPNEAFNVRLSGISRRGYPFEANLARRYTAPLPLLQLRTTAAPTQIARGETGIYSFHLNTTKTYPGCNLRLPISTEAQTDMVGVTLLANVGGTFSGSYTFSVRVTVSQDAPIRSGVVVLRIKDSKQKIILQSTAKIKVGVSVVNVASLQEVTTLFDALFKFLLYRLPVVNAKTVGPVKPEYSLVMCLFSATVQISTLGLAVRPSGLNDHMKIYGLQDHAQ